jgi:hypothetical protein
MNTRKVIRKNINYQKRYNPKEIAGMIRERFEIDEMKFDVEVLKHIGVVEPGIVDSRFYRFTPEEPDKKIKKTFKQKSVKAMPLGEYILSNIQDPEFAKKYPNATVWFINGKYYYMSFEKNLKTGEVEIFGGSYKKTDKWSRSVWVASVPCEN